MPASESRAASACDGLVLEVKYSPVWGLAELVSGVVLLGAAVLYLDASAWDLSAASVLDIVVGTIGAVILMWAILRGIPRRARARIRLYSDRLVYSDRPGETTATLPSRFVDEIVRLGYGKVGFVVGGQLVCVRPLTANSARMLAESASDTWRIRRQVLTPLANWWRSVVGLRPYDLEIRPFEYEKDEVVAK
jgi:hypothetical protein